MTMRTAVFAVAGLTVSTLLISGIIVLLLLRNRPHPLPLRQDRASGPQFLFPQLTRHHLRIVLSELRGRGFRENVAGRPAYKDEDQAAIWKRVNHVKEYSLIWSFRHSGRLDYTRLQESHRVNHFPNNIMLTSKSRLSFLARSLHRKDPKGWEHMPRHFLLPEEKADFMSAVNDPHHRKRWVIKSRTHRGVRIFDASAAALRASTADGEEDVMAAEYVEPFLVSDHKFDVGVYIAITSIDPLEVYMYDNVLLRFCKLPHPRGEITPETPLESYVINDYQPPWEMEALREFYERGGGIPSKENKGFSHRAALSAHFESVGKSSKHFWQRVKEIVLDVIFEAERDMLVSLRKKTRNRRTCFELFRWDFLVNANGNPVLNEVNMSPNLQPKYFASGNDYWMKRGLVRDLLRMVGVGGWSQPEPSSSLSNQSKARCHERAAACPQSYGSCIEALSCISDPAVLQITAEFAQSYGNRGSFDLIFPDTVHGGKYSGRGFAGFRWITGCMNREPDFVREPRRTSVKDDGIPCIHGNRKSVLEGDSSKCECDPKYGGNSCELWLWQGAADHSGSQERPVHGTMMIPAIAAVLTVGFVLWLHVGMERAEDELGAKSL